MRISDWSSDVCSSDLRHGEPSQRYDRDAEDRGIADQGGRIAFGQVHKLGPGLAKPPGDHLRQADAMGAAERSDPASVKLRQGDRVGAMEGMAGRDGQRHGPPRSEEHTSEPQSLMRNS